MTPPLVIDIYHGDVVQDFAKVAASGIIGVIHKASQGSAVVDHAYASRRKQALAAGLLWGAYHFMDFSSAPHQQADFFLSVADADTATLVALDWETIGGRQPSAAAAREFLNEIIQRLDRKAVIYSGNVAKEQIQGADSFFGSHRLWLAQYGSHWSVQRSWRYPWLWQNNGDAYGPGPHFIPGMVGLCDNDTVTLPMTADRLKAEWAS